MVVTVSAVVGTLRADMASRSATETWPGLETASKQRLAHTQ